MENATVKQKGDESMSLNLKMLRARKQYLLKSQKITQAMIDKVNLDIGFEVEREEDRQEQAKIRNAAKGAG